MATQTPLEIVDEGFDRWMDDRRYRSIIIDVLQDVVARSQAGSVRTVSVFDEASNQYQVLDIGWDESGKRIFQPMIHLELLNGKIWIQENLTDLDIAKVFLEYDIEKSDIVLGLHFPGLRQFSEYAIE